MRSMAMQSLSQRLPKPRNRGQRQRMCWPTGPTAASLQASILIRELKVMQKSSASSSIAVMDKCLKAAGAGPEHVVKVPGAQLRHHTTARTKVVHVSVSQEWYAFLAAHLP